MRKKESPALGKSSGKGVKCIQKNVCNNSKAILKFKFLDLENSHLENFALNFAISFKTLEELFIFYFNEYDKSVMLIK